MSPGRLEAVSHVLRGLAAGHDDPPAVSTTTDLDTALRGADFVFSAIRVGGLAGRTADERVALELGLVGQETTGAGGVAYGLRTVPVAVRVAERVATLAPDAWVINFTNPAGMVTEAMRRVLGDRVIGICDSPLGLVRRAAAALGLDPARVSPGYVGLNHLGWLRGLTFEGRDVLPRLLADDDLLGRVEEARLFGPDWVRALGAMPNEYLYYYYFTREAVAAGSGRTRGSRCWSSRTASTPPRSPARPRRPPRGRGRAGSGTARTWPRPATPRAPANARPPTWRRAGTRASRWPSWPPSPAASPPP
ncbi:hypothetical protein ACFQQB_53060 [Nonomuraea rubra]|uniref:family 4 glycosyl hydrolase n=1 Tax=Nonomuraea rubra TaxID=46180 RepID=UPI00360BFC56